MRLNLRLFSLILASLIVAGAGSAQAGPKTTSTPAQQQTGSGYQFDFFKFVLDQAVINRIPAPYLHIGAYPIGGLPGCAFNVFYASGKMHLQQNRELGNGEATGMIMDCLLNPTPFPIWQPIMIQAWSKINLCLISSRPYRDYMGLQTPQRDTIPLEARHVAYEFKYCGGKWNHQWDIFRDELGIPRGSIMLAPPKNRNNQRGVPQVSYGSSQQQIADKPKQGNHLASVEDVGADWSKQQMRSGPVIVLSE